MLSGPGGLEGAATLSVLLVYYWLHIRVGLEVW